MINNYQHYEITPLRKSFFLKVACLVFMFFNLFSCSDNTPNPIIEIDSPNSEVGPAPASTILGPLCLNSGQIAAYIFSSTEEAESIIWSTEGNISLVENNTGLTVLVLAGPNYSGDGRLHADATFSNGATSGPIFDIAFCGNASNTCNFPEIFAIDSNGPNTTHSAGTFVDFHPAPGPQQFPGTQFEWSSSPTIPGMTSSGSQNLMKTVYIPPTTPSGEYVVIARDPATGCFTAVEFNIVNGSGSGGGPGGGPGGNPIMN